MTGQSNAKDRYGYPLSTGSGSAAAHYVEGMDLLLSQNFGAEQRLEDAIEADEGFAVAHGALAFLHMTRGQVPQARESAHRARDLSPGISPREKRQVETVALWAEGKGIQSLTLIREHLLEFPRDAMLLRLAQRLYMLGCSGSGSPNFPQELMALLKSVAEDYGDDWSFLGQYAFAHHETGSYDEALRLAERSLEIYPLNAAACHSVTHVFFERGDAGGGGVFLGGWLPGFDKRASYHVHLSWHLALFELAVGRYQKALDLYESDIRPSVVAKSPSSLADSASLLWRLQIYSGTPPPKPWDEVREQALAAAANTGPAFRDAHACLAFAAASDDDGLSRIAAGWGKLAEDGNPLASEVMAPMIHGIEAFGHGDYQRAVDCLEPVIPQLVRIGGSHAQREVFEDTLLESYLRAGSFVEAETMLRSRLKRRASVRDTFWLGRAQAAAGRLEDARSSLNEAVSKWQGGDKDSPEIRNLVEISQKVA